MDKYDAPWWLPGGHFQTAVARWSALGQRVDYERERWNTPDGDFVDVDWAGPEHAPRLLVLFHGLEGNSRAHYARALAARAVASGCWRFALPHFRGCSGEANLKARSYFSGDSQEIDWMLRRFAERNPAVHAVGVSLGGNSLLKWLCDSGEAAGKIVCRAAAVSAQFDLKASGEALGSGFNRIYGWFFLYLTDMRRKALDKLVLFPEQHKERRIDKESVCAASTFPEFDDALVAPLHGFGNKNTYWECASTKELLPRIRVPTLLLNARNDPFLPQRVLPKDHDLPENVETDFPDSGGHASFPGRRQWLARRVLEFLSRPE